MFVGDRQIKLPRNRDIVLTGNFFFGDGSAIAPTLSSRLQQCTRPINRLVELLGCVCVVGSTEGQWFVGELMKRCQWVEPVLVAQVKFTEWTSDDQLRQPVFLGLRTDKPAREVVRE